MTRIPNEANETTQPTKQAECLQAAGSVMAGGLAPTTLRRPPRPSMPRASCTREISGSWTPPMQALAAVIFGCLDPSAETLMSSHRVLSPEGPLRAPAHLCRSTLALVVYPLPQFSWNLLLVEGVCHGWPNGGLFARDGDCYVVDRCKELIKVKGFQVAPSRPVPWGRPSNRIC